MSFPALTRRCHRRIARALGIILIGAFGLNTHAQDVYRKPPAAIVKILEAPPTPSVSLDPLRKMMLLMDRESMPPISELAQPMLRLAGARINPKTNGPFNTPRILGFTLKNIADGKERKIALPDVANIGSPLWSPDGSYFAFTVTSDTGISLWVCDVATARAKSLTEPTLNAANGPAIDWMPDGRRLLCKFIPKDRGAPPSDVAVPTGPVIQETAGGAAAPIRTLQDLLRDEHDEALFDYYMTAQLAIIDVATANQTLLGKPAIYETVDPSPSGDFLLVSYIVRPYSYLVGSGAFPEIVEVWDHSGKVVTEVAKLPLRDKVPVEGVPTGPRGFQWQSNADKDCLFWAEALDGGDPKNKVPHRDRIVKMRAPFGPEQTPTEIQQTEHRFRGFAWLDQPSRGLITEYDRDRRWTRTWIVHVDAQPNMRVQPKLLFDRSVNDRYGDPGSPLYKTLPNGRSVILVHDNAIYLNGGGATPDGDRPFLDRLDLDSLKSVRLWQNTGESYEGVVDLMADDASAIMTHYETTKEPTNFFIRDLAGKHDRQITAFPDPAPELQGIHKELVTYTRDDGVKLSATLYLPPHHNAGEKLPLIVWAYPQEFNDPATAGQVSGSPYRFTRIAGISHLFLLLQGYAIMDNATMPIVGDPETMNDTFIPQIVASAKACIDKADAMGVGDPNRVGVGGHSYGAFMTANLLAHSDLFKAGCARSGAYNRTLTPFGFQSERRTIWEAPKPYIELSPFMFANKINEPLLLIHGQMDDNPGTFPIQSERLYQAIKGNGGKARLVMLPYEAHGYRAKESVMHVLAEMIDWFDTYVKHASAAAAPTDAAQH